MSEAPFVCTVCGADFGVNPRLARWLTGKVSAREFRKVCLCWVCARLQATVAAEAAEMEKLYR